MEIAVWIVSGLLALLYLFAGFTKTFTPLEKLRGTMPWTESIKNWTRVVGIVEILGAVGLILPRLLGQAKAAELLLLGEGFNGEQAAAWGIASEALGSGEEALAKAKEMAMRFESLPPEAVRISKQLMKAPDRELLRKVIEEEGALFTQRLRSPEAMAALAGFINRH